MNTDDDELFLWYGWLKKAISLISSRDHCLRSSPSRISEMPQAEHEPAQNLISGFVELSFPVRITTIPQRHNTITFTSSKTGYNSCNMKFWILKDKFVINFHIKWKITIKENIWIFTFSWAPANLTFCILLTEFMTLTSVPWMYSKPQFHVPNPLHLFIVIYYNKLHSTWKFLSTELYKPSPKKKYGTVSQMTFTKDKT